MNLADYITPWAGTAYRHIPDGSPHGVLDFTFASKSNENRWNVAGEPTVYLAGDPGIAVAEFGRHLRIDRAPGLVAEIKPRALYRLEVQVDALLDLRDTRLLQLLSIGDTAGYWLDKTRARTLASFIRTNTRAQAILVPSVAFLDDLQRWNCVLFLDKLPQDPSVWCLSATLERRIIVAHTISLDAKLQP